jgi:hypothetical protein
MAVDNVGDECRRDLVMVNGKLPHDETVVPCHKRGIICKVPERPLNHHPTPSHNEIVDALPTRYQAGVWPVQKWSLKITWVAVPSIRLPVLQLYGLQAGAGVGI